MLTITGTAADDVLVVGSSTAGGSTLGTITLNGKEILAGSVLVPDVSSITIDGGAGNNVLKFDESSGIKLPPGKFVGDDGRDTMTGGSGADNFVSGGGNDRIIGGPGDDTISTGDGSDEVIWNPGDGNDRVDGDAGQDTLLFNAGPEELVNLFEAESRAVLSFPPDPFSPPGTPPRLELSVAGFELMKINVADFGFRDVRVNDMPGVGYMVVRVDFAPFTGPGAGSDTILYRGTVGPDKIRLAGSPTSGVTVFGGTQTVLFDHANQLHVFGGDGDDVIDASRLAGGVVALTERGGGNPFLPNSQTDGDDTLIGTPGDDSLFGGSGSNTVDGRGGNDIIIVNS